MGKKKKRKFSNAPEQLQPKVKPKSKFNFWLIVGGIASLFAIILAIPPLRDMFLSPKESYKKETFIEGVLKPPLLPDNKTFEYSISELKPIYNQPSVNDSLPLIKGIKIKDFSKKEYVFVFVSGYIFTCFRDDFYKGIDLFNPTFNSCNSSHLILGVKDDRLYVSVEFKDLQKEETVGFIKYNKWSLYKPNLLDFNNDDQKLEVRDKQNNIVFSIIYEEDYAISISGYFIGPSSIIVMPNDPKKSKSINPYCVSKTNPSWKQVALEEISLLKSIF